MNCKTIESVIYELARDQVVEITLQQQALAHCEECRECSGSLANQRALTGMLRTFAQASESIAAQQSIEMSLRAALRNRDVTHAAPRSDYRRWYWTGAIAASLLIVFALSFARWRHEPVPIGVAEIPKTSVAGTIPKIASPLISPAAPKRTPRVADRHVARRQIEPKRAAPTAASVRAPEPTRTTEPSPTNSTTRDYSDREVATEFLPLGYGNALNLQDGGQIVRVEVPRTTLVSFGLPVNMNRFGERVKADMLVGADGAARAIRFVQ